VANTKSAIKRMRQSERRRLRNRTIRSRVRTAVKAARTAVANPGPEAVAAVGQAIRELDRAVSKGVIHRNTAARKKSALARVRTPG
jgi:small subunit ribosomal protein S20